MSNLIDSLNQSALADTSVRAILRRGMSYKLGTHVPSFRFVEPVFVQDGVGPKRRNAYYLAAALWANHSSKSPSGPRVSFAQACAHHYAKKGVESFSKAFVALLDANEEQLPRRLSSMLGQLSDYNIDFGALHDDLKYWIQPDKRIQIRWAMAFYQAHPNE